jgi:lysophospholipase L1-like esterase
VTAGRGATLVDEPGSEGPEGGAEACRHEAMVRVDGLDAERQRATGSAPAVGVGAAVGACVSMAAVVAPAVGDGARVGEYVSQAAVVAPAVGDGAPVGAYAAKAAAVPPSVSDRAPGAWPVPQRPSRAPRFAALGDSLTEGVGDRVGDHWRGWAALLASGIGGGDARAEFRNFAVSGALTRDVVERQAPEALVFEPDIAAVLVGVNDTLRRTFDIEDMARQLDAVCKQLVARGTVLLTACLPDPGSMLGLPLPLARPLARRQRAVNAVVHALSDRYGAVHLHTADAAWVADRSMWSADRLHPGERGHRMIARRFHELLAERGLAHGTAPGCEPEQPPPSRSASVLWLATAGTAWVARRCTDLLPQLMRLAGAEVRHWARGTSARLDRSAEHALSSALAAVSLDAPLAGMGE